MSTDVMRLDPQVEAMVDARIQRAVDAALARQRTEMVSSPQAFEAAMATAEKIAQTGILGTQDKGVVLKLYLLAKDEGISVTQVQSRWHVWDQGGKITTQRKAESMLADFRRAGGLVKWLETTPGRVSAAFKAPNEEPFVVTADDTTVKRAGLGGRPIHGTYGEDMKVWYVVRRGIRRAMPECLTGDPLDGDEAAEVGTSDNFDVPANWQAVEPERPTPGTPAAQERTPAVDVRTEMKKAASDSKKLWHPEGKPTKDDYTPAWAWLSIRVGAPIAGPGDITADTLDLAREVLALGKEGVLLCLSEHKAQQDAVSADVVDAEFEEAPDNDDPFDGVA